MNSLRRNWRKLPSGTVVGVALSVCALAPEAVALENGDCVSISTLAVSDRAAIWEMYRQDREDLMLAVYGPEKEPA